MQHGIITTQLTPHHRLYFVPTSKSGKPRWPTRWPPGLPTRGGGGGGAMKAVGQVPLERQWLECRSSGSTPDQLRPRRRLHPHPRPLGSRHVHWHLIWDDLNVTLEQVVRQIKHYNKKAHASASEREHVPPCS